MARIKITRERMAWISEEFEIDTEEMGRSDGIRLQGLIGSLDPIAHPDGHLHKEFLDALLEDADVLSEDHWGADGPGEDRATYEIED